MKKKKKESLPISDLVVKGKNKLKVGDSVLYSFNTHIEKCEVTEVNSKFASLNNGVKLKRRYNDTLLRYDGKIGYVILPWSEEAELKWSTYTISMSLNKILNSTLNDIKNGTMPYEKLKKLYSKLEKITA